MTRRDSYMIMQYLVYWIEYRPEFDQWYSKDKLDNTKELIDGYKTKAYGMRGPCHHCSH